MSQVGWEVDASLEQERIFGVHAKTHMKKLALQRLAAKIYPRMKELLGRFF